jgi:tetratricopeptide (TPR) repeat protein
MDRRQLAGYAYHNCEFVHAINLLKSERMTSGLAAVHVKSLCELDEKAAAVACAESYLVLFPECGTLHYLLGMARYLAGSQRTAIEAAFLAAAERDYPGGSMGLAFMEFAEERPESAVRLLHAARSDEEELEHIRLLMLFQVQAAAGELTQAEASLRTADRAILHAPSLLRQFWGQLCWVRLLMAKSSFEGAQAILQRVLDQLDEHLMPRLHRNALEAQRMIRERDEGPNIILLRQAVRVGLAHERAGGAATATGVDLGGFTGAGLAEITRKPMLHSLFSYLSGKGERGASKEDIVSGVWEEPYNPTIHDDRIYKAIGRLRRLLGDDQHAPKYLTQMGRLYILNVPARPAPSQEST